MKQFASSSAILLGLKFSMVKIVQASYGILSLVIIVISIR